MPCGYHSLDANGVIVEINNTALRWLGHTRDEIVGKREFAEFLTGECRDRFRTAFARFKAGNPVSVSSREQTFELRCGDGSCRTVAITSSMVVDGAGGYLMSRSTVYDITQQERAAQALRATLDNTPNVAVQWFDVAGCVCYWNPASEMLYGIDSAEAMGRRMDELLHTPEQYREFVAFLSAVERGQDASGITEATVRGRHGISVTVMRRASVVPGVNAEPIFACMEVDITDERALGIL